MSAGTIGQALRRKAWRALTWPIRWAARAIRAALKNWLGWLTAKAAAGTASLARLMGTLLLLAASAGAGTLLFIGLPDIDLALMPILHHRSIMTHSVLLSLPLLWLPTPVGRAFAVGGLVALSVHLSADLLSPMVGFAQIWLPWPIKTPLGPLSYLWLALNAAFAIALAVRVARRGGAPRVSVSTTIAYACIPAIVYGLVNEGSWVASVTAIGIIVGGAALELLVLNRAS